MSVQRNVSSFQVNRKKLWNFVKGMPKWPPNEGILPQNFLGEDPQTPLWGFKFTTKIVFPEGKSIWNLLFWKQKPFSKLIWVTASFERTWVIIYHLLPQPTFSNPYPYVIDPEPYFNICGTFPLEKLTWWYLKFAFSPKFLLVCEKQNISGFEPCPSI